MKANLITPPWADSAKFRPPGLLDRLVEETADDFVTNGGDTRLVDCAVGVLERNRGLLDRVTPMCQRLNLHLTVAGMAIDVLLRGRRRYPGLEAWV